MIGAFLFLISRSFANRTKARLKRLKQPKYFVGAIFGVIYLGWYFFQFFLLRGTRGMPGQLTLNDSVLPMIGVIVLFTFIASAWIFPHARAALVFSEAEIAFLFPAPVTRRMLIHFKLLRSQIAILFTVLILTLVTGQWFVSSQAWMRVLGWWVILSTLGLHFLGASFSRTLLIDRGISNGLRRAIVLLVLAGLIGGTIAWARKTLPIPHIDNVMDWKAWADYAQELLRTPPLSYLVYPLRLVLAPFFATRPWEFARALLPASGIMGLHYLWVIRSNVAFEEASLELSRRFAERMAAARQGKAFEARPAKGRRAAFRLSPRGWPPIAFLWKNLIHARAMFRARTILIFALPLLIMTGFMVQSASRGSTLAMVAAMLLFMFFICSLVVGPQMVRCDFRQDLGAMDVLKQYPLRGWQVVAGEILAPTLILSVVQWLMLAGLAVLTTFAVSRLGLMRIPVSWIAAVALLAPFWNALALLIPNTAVLLFPGWFQVRPDAPQGIEVTGQRLLLLFGQLLAICVTVVPAALAFLAGFLPLQFADATTVAPLAGAFAATLALSGEVALGVWLVGKLFDRFDLAAEQGG